MTKIKLMGIGVVATLLLASFAMAEQANIDKKVTEEGASLDVDAPVWDVGDSWTYKMELYGG